MKKLAVIKHMVKFCCKSSESHNIMLTVAHFSKHLISFTMNKSKRLNMAPYLESFSCIFKEAAVLFELWILVVQ